jgi:uncharacterized protein YcbK (DUF882 family)
MRRDGTTVLVLRPGRDTLRFELSRRWPWHAAAVLLALVLMGAAGRNGWDALHGVPAPARAGGEASTSPSGARSSLLLGVARAQPASVAVASRGPRAAKHAAHERDAAQHLQAPVQVSRAPLPVAPASVGELSIRAVHFDEDLRVRPFDEDGKPVRAAFAAIDHLMRCRVTGEEVPIDPRLVRLLMLLSALYERPIEVISGHRAAHTLGTSPDSQHVLGRAADIRLEGVPIRQLRRRAVEVGARGVGLYPERGFLHVDVRTSSRYYWGYTEATGELPYDRFLARGGRAAPPPAVALADPESGEFE